jgi:hypothetical protein
LTRSEDDLQYSVYNLNNIVEEISTEINTTKTKIMTFRGQETTRRKICINSRILKGVNNFNYMGCNIHCEGGKDLNKKITNFLR